MNNQEKTNYQNKLKQMTMEFNLPKDQSSIIKVIGVGGGGGNAVNHMFEQGIRGVNYIICNTDQQALDLSPVVNKIQLGPEITQGLGAGSLPSVGEQATLESEQDIKDILANNTKMCFVTAGMGGGTGTGGAPVVAQIARDMGILTVGIVTTPFSFEGRRKLIQADEGIKKLKESVDALIVVSNDKIREMFGNLSNRDAFSKADEVLLNAAKSISEIITVPGQINVDFADVQYVMKNSGIAIMGTGEAEGEERSLRAVQMALNSPLLDDNNITGAKNILINISSGAAQVTIDEITEISNYVQDAAGNETDIIFGTCDDDTLGDKLNITIIATGFEKKIAEQVVIKKEVVSLDNTPTPQKNEENSVMSLEDEVQENTINFDVEETSKQEEIDELEGMTLKEKEVPAEEPKLSFYTSDSKPLVEQKKPTQEDQKEQEFVSHKQRLKDLSYKWDAKQKDMEDIPAYKRRGVDLNDVENSATNTNSKYTLDSFDLENGDRKPEIRKNNKFLDDNVD